MPRREPETDSRIQAERLPGRLLEALADAQSPLDLAPHATAALAEAIGGACILWLQQPDSGRLLLADARHRDPAKTLLVLRLAQGLTAGRAGELSQGALKSNWPVWLTLERDEEALSVLGSRERTRLAQRTGLRMLLVVPLIHRDRRLGSLAVGVGHPVALNRDETVSLLQEVAGHLAAAIVQLQRLSIARRASEQLTLTSLRLHTILESIPQGIIVADAPSGRIVFTNRSMCRLLGLLPNSHHEGVIERALQDAVDRAGEGSCSCDLPWLARAHVEGPTPPGELRLRRTDGSDATVLCSASPILDERGAPVGHVAVLQDVSELKEFELQKDQFLAMVAHELKTPLTSLKGYAQLLIRRSKKADGTPLGTKELAMLQVIDRQVSRLTELVSGLVDFSMIQMGRLDLLLRVFDLAALAEDVGAQMQVAWPDRRIGTLIEGPAFVRADASRLEQVLTNLVSNAIKATEAGGSIEIRVYREGPAVVASVRDNGTGMPEDVQARVFERLFRGYDSYREGMGLGLYISRGIVESHGGKIWFETKPGQGTTFYFSLPAAV